MSTVLVLVVYNTTKQAVIPKSMVSDLKWFNSNQIKFEDQQREIQLFLKSNRVTTTDKKITTILAHLLAHLRGGIIGIYTQKKLDQIEDEEDIQDWKEFVKEIKTTFSNKSKKADAK